MSGQFLRHLSLSLSLSRSFCRFYQNKTIGSSKRECIHSLGYPQLTEASGHRTTLALFVCLSSSLVPTRTLAVLVTQLHFPGWWPHRELLIEVSGTYHLQIRKAFCVKCRGQILSSCIPESTHLTRRKVTFLKFSATSASASICTHEGLRAGYPGLT